MHSTEQADAGRTRAGVTVSGPRFTFEHRMPGSSTIVAELDSVHSEQARMLIEYDWEGVLTVVDRLTGQAFSPRAERNETTLAAKPDWPAVDTESDKREQRARWRRGRMKLVGDPVVKDPSFKMQTVLLAFFSRSLLGRGANVSLTYSIMKHIEDHSARKRKCGKCKGSGFVGTKEKSLKNELAKARAELLSIKLREKSKQKDFETCPKCDGCGFYVSEGAPMRDSKDDIVFATKGCRRCTGRNARDRDGRRLKGSPATGLDCRMCEGEGYLENLSARFAGIPPEPSYELDEGWLIANGRLVSALARMREADSLYPLIFELFWGPAGSRWEERHGRRFPLYPLTTTGRKTIARLRDQGRGLHDLDLLDEEAQLQVQQFSRDRALAFRRMHEEAGKLYTKALEAWCAVPSVREMEDRYARNDRRAA